MNEDTLKGQWKQVKGRVREQWGKLTNDDVDQIGGQTEQLVGKVQERYGIARDEARRQERYRIRLRLWLHTGDPVRWQGAWEPVGAARLEDDGATLVTEVRIDRRSLVNGLFYGVEGMRVGGMRRLQIAPHLAYADRGVPGVIPPGAALTAEITILERAD